MKRRVFAVVVCIAFLFQPAISQGQAIERPEPSVVKKAKDIVADSIFARLEAGQSDALAEWVTDQVHSEASGTSRMQQLTQFKSQFNMISGNGPESPFGAMAGYDLIQESFLPGTDRYFRLTYMTYHQRVPLIWEIHFYVEPDGDLSMAYFQFDGQNPFRYMTTSDMLIDKYYDVY